jgi:hypothetical protein
MNIENFKNGWIVGNFEPSLFKSESVDIGILFLKSGEKGDGHFHKIHTEYNIIINGKAKINENILINGDIFIYNPFEKSNVEYLEDTTLLVVKTPATKNDKYY